MAATYADETFERLYVRYVGEVYRYALALLRNPADAEDVTQTTFLNAYRALRAGQRPRRPHNWLIAITHNVCRSRVRFAMRRPKEVPLDDVVEQLAVPEADRPNIRELLHTIRRLPFNQRAAITMRELEGRSYVEIAETLGVTVPAAEALIGRARQTLRARAAAFRVLLLLPLPRRLAQNGEAAVGTAAVVKVAALVIVGAVGGGVGVAAGSGPHARPTPVRPVLSDVPISRSTASTSAVHVGSTVARPAARPRQPESQAAAPATTAPAPAATTAAAAPVSTAAPAETAAAAAAAGTTVTGSVTETAQPVSTAISQLPTVTTPAATTPPVTTPPVTTPPVTTPVATVPPVTVPTVTVPTVTIPPPLP